MLIIFGFICIILVLWTMLLFFNISSFPTIEYLLVMCALILGFATYFKAKFFEIPQLNHPKNRSLNYDDKQKTIGLNQIFEYRMLYIRPKLTVAEVAKELNLPVKYVSHPIGIYCGNNFDDFANKC